MALVVLLRGVNVGGHRTFRPTTLVERLQHLDAVNIGAAGTFVIRQPVTQARLRATVARELPFDADINRFILGVYRRQMKAIGYLGTLDRLFGVPATTRNWNTMIAIAKVLEEAENRGRT